MVYHKPILVSAIVLALMATSLTWGQSMDAWPQFLGAQRNGLAGETEILEHFPEAGPERLWRVPVATGMSGLAVSRGKIFTLAQDESGQFALALDLKQGEVVWRQRIAEPYKNSQGDGPRSTPTVVDDAVIAFTGQGWLVSLDRESGNPNVRRTDLGKGQSCWLSRTR